MAKPKGKKPITINQLSGGEKTLTATSLLFAIYLLKPAPFCVFDEVDAPLDDANIDKFNKIVNKFSNTSQFIIVTHNKRTMNNADVIYGITMPEQGVSKVVPVDLRKLNKVLKITRGVDAVLHFGGIPRHKPHEDVYYKILDHNILGTYNVFEACITNKVKRVIFASSAHAIGYHNRKKKLNYR